MALDSEREAGECWLKVYMNEEIRTTTVNADKNLFFNRDGLSVLCHGKILDVINWLLQLDEKSMNSFTCNVFLKPYWIHNAVVDILSDLGVTYKDDNFCAPPELNFDGLETFLEGIEPIFTDLSRDKIRHKRVNDTQSSTKEKPIFRLQKIVLDKNGLYSLFMESYLQTGSSDLSSPFTIYDMKEIKALGEKITTLENLHRREIDAIDINEDVWNYILEWENAQIEKILNVCECEIKILSGSEGQKQIKIFSKADSKNPKSFECVESIIGLYQKFMQKDIVTEHLCIKDSQDLQDVKNFVSGKKLYGSCLYHVCGPRNAVTEIKKILDDRQAKKKLPTENEVLAIRTLASGLKIFVSKGNLINQRTDAIVNPANSNLRHGGGAAAAIAKAAGHELDKECREYIDSHKTLPMCEAMHTTAGNMRPSIKHVIHTVGPEARGIKHFSLGEKRKYSDLMVKTFFNCLQHADKVLSLASVAIPAISSGIFGVPLDIVASAMFEAVDQFDRNRGARNLKEIHFVNIDDPTVKGIQSAFNNWNHGSSVDTATNSRHDARNKIEELTHGSLIITGKKNSISQESSSENQEVPMDADVTDDHSEQPASNGKLKDEGSEDKVHPSGHRLQSGAIQQTSQEERDKGGMSKDQCVICMEDLTDPTKLRCGHVFCKKCMDEYNKVCSHKCPTCGHIYGVLKGNQPDGKMTIKKSHKTLAGHEGHGAIEITYHFPNGTQNESHSKPGMKYWGTTRTALLPDNPEGREVARMLERAFNNRLLFTIGRSHTNNVDDVVVWNDIHHKTSTYGTYGYPDPGYLTRVKAELAAKGIFPESNKGK